MLPKKKEHPKEKSKLHSRNKHRFRYDFKALIASCSELAPFVSLNKFNDESIDFFNPEAVKMLNKALLKHHYNIENWNIPSGYLCPPIPGRADYIHHIADLLTKNNDNKIPTGKAIKVLDIGVGANCVYPLIGSVEYGWSFVGSEIDSVAVASANQILRSNPFLKEIIEIRQQMNSKHIFTGIIQNGEQFDMTICNPPFHASAEEAAAGTMRKLKNLKGKKVKQPTLNFSGQNNELWCEGGEVQFVEKMILESVRFATSVFWFSSLISKESNLEKVYNVLKKAGAISVKTIPMAQGNKVSRLVAWTFLTLEQQKSWKESKWQKSTNGRK
jgi:23S rRNA (adenine1618-N6)-methyltransferase